MGNVFIPRQTWRRSRPVESLLIVAPIVLIVAGSYAAFRTEGNPAAAAIGETVAPLAPTHLLQIRSTFYWSESECVLDENGEPLRHGHAKALLPHNGELVLEAVYDRGTIVRARSYAAGESELRESKPVKLDRYSRDNIATKLDGGLPNPQAGDLRATIEPLR